MTIVAKAFTIMRVAIAHSLTAYARSYLLVTCVWSLVWHTAIYYPPVEVPKITAHTLVASAVGAFLTFGPNAKPDPATLAIRGAALDAVRTWRSKMVAAWHRSMANGGPPPAAPNAAQLRDCFRARLVRCIEVDHCSTLDTSKCTTGGDGLRARARKQRTHTKHEFDDRWGPLAQWHQDSGPSLHWDTVT